MCYLGHFSIVPEGDIHGFGRHFAAPVKSWAPKASATRCCPHGPPDGMKPRAIVVCVFPALGLLMQMALNWRRWPPTHRYGSRTIGGFLRLRPYAHMAHPHVTARYRFAER